MRYLLMIALFALVGCASVPKPPANPAVTILADLEELPPPTGFAGSAARGSAEVGPLDTLSLDVFGVEGLKREKIQVSPAGTVSFPLIGNMDVNGMTIEELEERVSQGLRGAGLRDPRVAINFVDVQSQFVTVEGEVKKAGLYPVRKDMTLLRALASAEGLEATAGLGNVVVFRTVGGRKMAALYNLRAIRMGYYDDPALYEGDVVAVNQDRAALLFQQVLGFLPALSYVVVALLN